MKKVLTLMLIMSFKMFGQTSKIDVVVDDTENIDGIKAVLKNTNSTSYSSAISGANLSTNGYGYGVKGSHQGFGIGVSGQSSNGAGVSGFSINGNGVSGYSNNDSGVSGWSPDGTGVNGYSNSGVGGYFSSSFGYALRTNGKIRLEELNGAGVNKFLKSINSEGDAEWSDLFPISNSQSSSLPIIDVTNTGNSSAPAIKAQTYSQGIGAAIYGEASGVINGVGVYGYSAKNGRGIWGNSNSGIAVQGSSTGNGVGGRFQSDSGYALVTGPGKVGIGNYTPNLNSDERVEINGRLRIRDSTSTAGVWFNNSANSIGLDNGAFYGLETAVSGSERAGIWIGSDWRFYINRVGNANFTGTVTATGFPIASDLRYKKNIQPLENTLSKVQKIVGVSYDLRKDEFPEKNFSDQPQIGFIAQDIEKIFPEMVFTDEKGYKSVDYARLTPVLVETLKELILKNQTLETKNQTLESRLDKIEAMLSTIQPNTENLNSKK